MPWQRMRKGLYYPLFRGIVARQENIQKSFSDSGTGKAHPIHPLKSSPFLQHPGQLRQIHSFTSTEEYTFLVASNVSPTAIVRLLSLESYNIITSFPHKRKSSALN